MWTKMWLWSLVSFFKMRQCILKQWLKCCLSYQFHSAVFTISIGSFTPVQLPTGRNFVIYHSYLNFSLKFTGILTCPWGQKYIFRNLYLSCLTDVWTATPQKGNFHQSRRKYTLWFYLFNFIIRFVGSQENVPLIFPSYSSSLLPLRFLFL